MIKNVQDITDEYQQNVLDTVSKNISHNICNTSRGAKQLFGYALGFRV